jgi:hypothetical protein
MNVNKTHGCLLLVVGSPLLLLSIFGLIIELSDKQEPGGLIVALVLLLLGGAGVVSGFWLRKKGKAESSGKLTPSGSAVDPATARAHIKTWVIVGFGFAGLYTLLAVLGFADAIRISPAVNWSVSITALLFWIGILFAVIRQYSVARVFFLIGGILGLPLSVPMIIAGKRLELAGQALARAEEPLEQPGDASAHKSAFADQLICKYCGVENHATEWPSEGDAVPFAYEAEPGNFNLKVHCPHCERDWYVVWDENPGALEAVSL